MKISLPLVSLAIGLGLGMTAPAMAGCDKGSKVVFSCLTAKGKSIEVCDSGKTIDYSFGKPGTKPEIVVRALRKDASTYQWQGVGRAISYSVSVPNGEKTVYTAFWSADRMDEKHGIEAGVNVEISGKQVATVNCGDPKQIVQNIEGIDLKPSE